MKRAIYFLPVFLVLLSCSQGKIYEKHVKMENLAWNRFNTLTFEVPIKDTRSAYDIYITLRHITDIPYRDIEVFFYFTTPDGETRSRNIELRIKDREGNNLGDGLGELWDLQKLAWPGFRFREEGICTFEVSSAMSQMDLVGVLEVGLIVKKSR